MAGRFPPDWLEELRLKADIVQIIGSYVPLKKNGNRYAGLCPFHHETAPSFYVDEQKQLFHCFGCKAGGTVFQFIMEMENLSFYEAVKHLAEQLGVPLPEMKNDPLWEKKRTLKERLFLLNKEAAQIYHSQLWSVQGKPILDYHQNRGLSDGMFTRFGLGATVPSAGVGQKLLDMGFTKEEVEESGIIRPPEEAGHIKDMFFNRAMFPIIDAWGNVLGFGGRVIGDGNPKYLNTRDTPVFNKRYNVYGANLLRKEKHLPRVLLVEGYMDVVALSQFGVVGVAATLGTAFTVEQAQLLKRFAPEVHLCYDGDRAGQTAILRGLDIMEQAGVPCRVVDLPGGLDPDEYVRRQGVEAFHALNTLSPTQYRMLREKEKHDLSTEEGRTAYAIQCAAHIRKLSNPVEAENHLKRLALETGYSVDVLRSQVGQFKPAGLSPEKTIRRLHIKQQSDDGHQNRAQAFLLSLLASGRLPSSQIQAEWFEEGLYRDFAQSLLEGVKPAAYLDSLTEGEQRNTIAGLLTLVGDEDDDTLMNMAGQALKALKEQKLQREIQAVKDDVSLEDAARMLANLSGINNPQPE